MASDEARAGTQVLGFSLGAEACALEIRGVREIIQVGPMTPVPLMPSFVRGIINLRGAVVPVVDLNARFGRAPARVGKKSCIVVFDASADGERAEIGLLVDAVSEVVEIGADATEPPPAFGTPIAREFIRAVAKVRDRFVLVLEPQRACDIGELASLCEAGAEAAFA